MTEPATRRVALFGGSFNPPHICHTLATHWVLQTTHIDQMWWIPTYQHAFDKALASFDDRLAMCRLATADLRRVEISDVERRLGGESRTIDTVRALQEENPDIRFSLVIGADILDEVDRWKNWEGLMELVDLIVVGREGYDRQRHSDEVDLELPDISSTVIRDALARCDYSRVRSWIPRKVLAYIGDHSLYLGEACR